MAVRGEFFFCGERELPNFKNAALAWLLTLRCLDSTMPAN